MWFWVSWVRAPHRTPKTKTSPPGGLLLWSANLSRCTGPCHASVLPCPFGVRFRKLHILSGLRFCLGENAPKQNHKRRKISYFQKRPAERTTPPTGPPGANGPLSAPGSRFLATPGAKSGFSAPGSRFFASPGAKSAFSAPGNRFFASVPMAGSQAPDRVLWGTLLYPLVLNLGRKRITRE